MTRYSDTRAFKRRNARSPEIKQTAQNEETLNHRAKKRRTQMNVENGFPRNIRPVRWHDNRQIRFHDMKTTINQPNMKRFIVIPMSINSCEETQPPDANNTREMV